MSIFAQDIDATVQQSLVDVGSEFFENIIRQGSIDLASVSCRYRDNKLYIDTPVYFMLDMNGKDVKSMQQYLPTVHEISSMTATIQFETDQFNGGNCRLRMIAIGVSASLINDLIIDGMGEDGISNTVSIAKCNRMQNCDITCQVMAFYPDSDTLRFFPDMVNCNITIPFGFVFISFVKGNTLINKAISEKIVNWGLMHKYSKAHNIVEYEDLLCIKDSGYFDIKLGDPTDYILPILRGVEMRKILNVPEALWRVNTFKLSITNRVSLIFTRDVLQNYKTDLLLTGGVDNIRDYQTLDGFYLYFRKS